MPNNFLDNTLLAQLWNKTINTFQLRAESLYYSSTKTYAVDDVVEYNNKLYQCIQTSTGNLPTNTTYWSIFQGGGGSGTITDVKVNNSTVVSGTVANIPAANGNTAGVVSSGAQTFNGAKTFNGTPIFQNGLTQSNGQASFMSQGTPIYISTDRQTELLVADASDQGGSVTYSINVNTNGWEDDAHYTIALPGDDGTLALTSQLPQIIDLR